MCKYTRQTWSSHCNFENRVTAMLSKVYLPGEVIFQTTCNWTSYFCNYVFNFSQIPVDTCFYLQGPFLTAFTTPGRVSSQTIGHWAEPDCPIQVSPTCDFNAIFYIYQTSKGDVFVHPCKIFCKPSIPAERARITTSEGPWPYAGLRPDLKQAWP